MDSGTSQKLHEGVDQGHSEVISKIVISTMINNVGIRDSCDHQQIGSGKCCFVNSPLHACQLVGVCWNLID